MSPYQRRLRVWFYRLAILLCTLILMPFFLAFGAVMGAWESARALTDALKEAWV